jgi:quinohemoprotein ethanol dehydrogenase
VQGGHGWHANSWNPETNLLYIATQRAWFVMRTDDKFTANPAGTNLGIDMGASFVYYQDNPDARREFVGYVQAWDPVAGREVWRSEELSGPTGGVLSTGGGLVFSGGGNNNNVFRAYNTETGEKVWEFDTQTGVVAAPITFELEGKQYIALSVGVNQAGNYYAPNYSRMLVFALDGNTQLPEPLTFQPPQLNPPALTASAEVVARGQDAYNANCSICHGNGGLSRGANFPNLLVSPMLHSQQGFDSIVLAGARAERGMPSFADKLGEEDTQAILGYLVSRATAQLAAEQAAPPIETAPGAQDVHEETPRN